MRIVLLGADGMLAKALREALAKQTLIPLTHHDCDVTKADAVRRRLTAARPDVIINGAAYTDVDGAEQQEALASAINGTAVGTIASIARELGSRVVHFSTDYVFDGRSANGYAEDDPVAPLNAYGRSKALGERLLKESGADYYLVRTAWLYGPGGKNFVDTILRLSTERPVLNVVADQIGSPTYTRDLAESVVRLLDQSPPFGVYHRTNDGVTAWYDFAKAIIELVHRTTDVRATTAVEYGQPANRPKVSVLRTTKLSPLRAWRAALTDYLSTTTP